MCCYSNQDYHANHTMVLYAITTTECWILSLASCHWVHQSCPSSLRVRCTWTEHSRKLLNPADSNKHPDYPVRLVYFLLHFQPCSKCQTMCRASLCIILFSSSTLLWSEQQGARRWAFCLSWNSSYSHAQETVPTVSFVFFEHPFHLHVGPSEILHFETQR